MREERCDVTMLKKTVEAMDEKLGIEELVQCVTGRM